MKSETLKRSSWFPHEQVRYLLLYWALFKIISPPYYWNLGVGEISVIHFMNSRNIGICNLLSLAIEICTLSPEFASPVFHAHHVLCSFLSCSALDLHRILLFTSWCHVFALRRCMFVVVSCFWHWSRDVSFMGFVLVWVHPIGPKLVFMVKKHVCFRGKPGERSFRWSNTQIKKTRIHLFWFGLTHFGELVFFLEVKLW